MRGKILLAAFAAIALLLAASLIGGRYQAVSAFNGSIVRLDRITGEMLACDLDGCWDVERGLPADGR